MADPALVELVISPDSDEAARARALRLLWFAAELPVRVAAVRSPVPLDRVGALVCPGHPVKVAPLADVGVLLVMPLDAARLPADVRAVGAAGSPDRAAQRGIGNQPGGERDRRACRSGRQGMLRGQDPERCAMEPKSPTAELFELAGRVTGRIVTYRFAVSHVVGRDWTELAEDDVVAAQRLVMADLNHDMERASVLARLTVLAAAARWGEDRDSPWWQAADVYVEATRQRLSYVADGDRLHEAVEVVSRQIAILDERLHDLRRRRFRPRVRAALIKREEQELADTLQGAAALVLGPYLANYDKQAVWETLNNWVDVVGPGRRLVRPTPDSDEPYHFLQGDLQVREDAEKIPMPSPVRAADAALAYLDKALTTARGHIRGLCLFKKVLALDFLWAVGGYGEDFEFEDLMLDTAREALDHLDGEKAPEDRMILIELLVRYGVIPKPRHLSDLLASPVNELRATHGPGDALRTLIMLGEFVSAPDILSELKASAEEILDDVADRRLILGYYDMIVHRFPENTFPCPGKHYKGDRVAVENSLPQLPAIHQRSPSAAAATLLHVISHVRDADIPVAMALLDKVSELDPVFAGAHKWLMLHISVSAGRRYAGLLAESGRLREALLAYDDIAEDLGRLVEHLRLPATLMQAFAHEVFRRCGPGEQSEESDLLASLLLAALNPVMRSLTPSRTPEHEDFVHGFGVLVDQRLRVSDSFLTFIHHCMFKGVDVGILLDNARRRNIGLLSSQLLQEIRAREAALGPYVPPRIDEIEESVEWVPSGTSALYYVTLGESAPDSREDGSMASLRKAFDRSVTSDLLTDLLTSDHPGLSTRHPITELDRIRDLLPKDTVLVSLFLGELSGTATQEVPVNNSCLTMFTMTADGWQTYLLRMNGMAGVVGIGSGDQLLRFHPLAVDVAELRLRLTADAHSRSVGPHAKGLLERHYGRFGGPPAEALARWRAEGRTHLCVWPHGPLHYVPFHLLHHDGRPLADDWTVTTIPTPAVLASAPSALAERRIVFAGTRTSHPGFGLTVQAAVSEHVQNLAARVRPSRLLVDAEVTPSSLLAAAEHATHLHIAAHGSHDAEAAWFQCLYLNPDPDNDGRLFAFQVAQADLSAVDLVTLSACESAMGRYDLNDNLRGLPAAFLLAGASTVIGALWPVTADAASTFFERLYMCLSAGDGKRAAFRTAQLLTRQRCPAYRDWGAFTYIGSWD
ncbi:CHAT domain-containing protein [Streptomyces olivochromogenes]|uniref:CHAT domain-containing protein n=1 Tax=Streptomyces olivochromogenes TaxID=1963 RepID=UPI001F25488C|nr:CHAT domain-containing protein [Streptomyces olivochromogenes]